jgi:ABC-type multidrug transport system ATPase subunit
MEWTNLRFSVKDKVILDNVSGSIQPGEMACILGPSGAGKSTLLNILAGRMNTKAKGANLTGSISMTGTIVDPVDVRSAIAYVMQDDALPGMSTPREILEMAGVLRGTGNATESAQQAGELLSALRLDKCADTRVGTALVKGISGGEKKRTAVSVELITKPRMIFLDEPLSGLDSYAAWTVVQVLKDLAASGCAVLCTVHQPSSEIFETFNKMICLAPAGRVAYCGEVSRFLQYMSEVGHAVPKQYNPADHILFLVQTLPEEELASFTQKWAVEEQTCVLDKIEARRSNPDPVDATFRQRKKPFLAQLGYLVERELKETLRNKVGLIMRFVVNGFMGLLFACIFLSVGHKSLEEGGVQSHFGAVCNIMIGTMFGAAQPLLLQFPSERPIFLREYAANMYGCMPYFLAKTIVEVPLAGLTSIETWAISYPTMGLHGNFLELVLISWALTLTASSTALFIGCSVANAQSAQELAPLMFVPQILFSGIFISITLIPPALRWLQYVAALKYAINLACIVEFHGLPEGPPLLKSMNIDPDNKWVYMGVLLGIFVGFRTLAMVNLRRKAKFVF